MGDPVKLARHARPPEQGDVLTFDGMGWVPDVLRSRWSIVHAGQSPSVAGVMEGPDIDVTLRAMGLHVGRGGDSVLVFDSLGEPLAEYAATGTGLAAAIAAAGTGDTVWLPARTINLGAGVTLDDGVTLAGMGEESKIAASGFDGTAITMADDAVCRDFELTYVVDGTMGLGIDARFARAVVAEVRVHVSGAGSSNIAVHIGAPPDGADEWGYTVTQNSAEVSDVWPDTDAYFEFGTAQEIWHPWVIHTGAPPPPGEWCYGVWRLNSAGAGPTEGQTGSLRVTVRCLAGAVDIIKLMDASAYGSQPEPELTGNTAGVSIFTGQVKYITPGGWSTATKPYYEEGYFAIATGWHPFNVVCMVEKVEWKDSGTSEETVLWENGLSNMPMVVGCRDLRAKGAGADGIKVSTVAGVLYSRAQGDTYDLNVVSGGTAFVCGAQYRHGSTTGDIAFLPGDRGTYDVEEAHANDIEDDALTRHLPLATAENDAVLADGDLNWALAAGPMVEGQVWRSGADPYTPAWTSMPVWTGHHTFSQGLTVSNTGLHILDTDASHDLIVALASDLTQDRVLGLVTGDAARTITLSGNPTLADWFDQSVKQAASPTFTAVYMPDGGFVGVSGADGWTFNSTDGNITTSTNCVGLGIADPSNRLQVVPAAANKFAANFAYPVGMGSFVGISFGNTAYQKQAVVFERTGTCGRGKLHILVNNDGDDTLPDLTNSKLRISNDGVGVSGVVAVCEADTPSNPDDGTSVIYAHDAGGGLTELRVRFPDGTDVQIATET